MPSFVATGEPTVATVSPPNWPEPAAAGFDPGEPGLVNGFDRIACDDLARRPRCPHASAAQDQRVLKSRDDFFNVMRNEDGRGS